MQSPALSNRADSSVALIQHVCARVDTTRLVQNTAEDVEREDLVFVGELRLNDSSAPVYAIRINRQRRDSIARAVAMRIWWYFGSRLWPCAEPDNEW